MESFIGRWYEISGKQNYKLEISNLDVKLFSNHNQKHPAYFDTLEFVEEYIGKQNGNVIELSKSIKLVSYNSKELKITVYLTTDTGNLTPMVFIKRL